MSKRQKSICTSLFFIEAKIGAKAVQDTCSVYEESVKCRVYSPKIDFNIGSGTISHTQKVNKLGRNPPHASTRLQHVLDFTFMHHQTHIIRLAFDITEDNSNIPFSMSNDIDVASIRKQLLPHPNNFFFFGFIIIASLYRYKETSKVYEINCINILLQFILSLNRECLIIFDDF